MKTQNNTINKIILLVGIFIISTSSFAQSKKYSRKETAKSADAAATGASAPATGAATSASGASTAAGGSSASATATGTKSGPSAAATNAGKDSEKLDIQELEEKYWAPKDTDFSVVQNRTYTKAKRTAVSLLAGPLINDPFNSGLNYSLNINYYMDERYGFEFMYQSSNLEDSDATEDFKNSDGGGLRPDFNRDVSFYGVGFNYVPFYAKMSFMGRKIIYFDMQITPFVGMSTYEQITESTGSPEETSFSYGFDVTQYFFFHKNIAARVNIHNRYFNADVRGYRSGSVLRSDETQNTTMFLMGLTYFF